MFSAILTAFNVQSYQLLQPAPTLDPVLVALQQISAQLSSFSNNPPFVNSTQPAYRQTDTLTPRAPRAAVWLNALWFSSLILSLSSASVGIMVKQWLNEYCGGISPSTSRETARLRQYRLNNLIKWRVGAIVMSIPVLLQLALSLFLAGLLILLWTLHNSVAAVASTLVFLLAAFTIGTMLLPLARFGCAYLSPQTYALDIVRHRVVYFVNDVRFRLFGALGQLIRRVCRASSGRAQHWSQAVKAMVGRCAGEGPESFRTWRGRERDVAGVGKESPLDADLLTMAYDTSMDYDTLSTVAKCLTDLQPQDVIKSFRMLDQVHLSHYSQRRPYFSSQIVYPEITLWTNTVLCLADVKTELRDAHWYDTLDAIYSYLPFCLKFYRPDVTTEELDLDVRRTEWILSAISSLAFNEHDMFPSSSRPSTVLLAIRGLLPHVKPPADGTVIRSGACTTLYVSFDTPTTTTSTLKSMRRPSNLGPRREKCTYGHYMVLLKSCLTHLADRRYFGTYYTFV